MRRKFFAIALLAAGLLCSGCSSRDGDRELSTELVQEKLDIPVYDTFTGPMDFSFDMDTDAQKDIWVGLHTETGIYHIQHTFNDADDIVQLYFYDYETQKDVPVCSRNDCLHEDKSCDAFLDNARYPGVISEHLYLVEGDICIPCVDQGYYCIERISPDGTTRELVCRLFRFAKGTEIDFLPEVCIHRGYAYFSTEHTGCESAELCRAKLEQDAQVEVLYTMPEEIEIPQLYRLKPYGRYLFFQMGELTEDEGALCDLYTFDTEKECIYLVKQDAPRDYTVGEDRVFYLDTDRNIMSVDLKTGAAEIFHENTGNETDRLAIDYLFIKDGRLYHTAIYVNDNFTLQYELDMEGNVLNTFRFSTGDPLLSDVISNQMADPYMLQGI